MMQKISMIIPVKNEEKSIDALLKSVELQTLQPEEIVITDGGSRDNTLAIIGSYVQRGLPIKLIKTAGAFPGKGRNIAIQAAANELIAMTDAGIVLDKNWLKELASSIEKDPGVEVVYGAYEPVTDSLFKECFALLALSSPVLMNGRWTRLHSVASLMLRKKVWSSVGGFPDFRAAEDKIFIDEIKKRGFVTALSPGAIALWSIPEGFRVAFRKVSLYSMHDLIAGRFNDWHRSVMLTYLLGVVIVMMGSLISPTWFWALPIGIFVRAIKILLKKSRGKDMLYILNVKRFLLLTALMLWMDTAMFWGAANYISYKISSKIKAA
jgi:glycosyltransferase involved in cell wall biosynthesis